MRRLALLALILALAAPGAAAAAEQVHLGLPTPDASTTASVHWLDLSAPPGGERSVVLRGPDGERTVPARVVDGPSAGTAYDATFEGLAPATTYEYEIDGRAFSFTTAPANATPFRFVALGDMGITTESRRVLATIQELAPDFVLHAGDVSYAEGNQVEWKEWFDMVEPVAARLPWLVAIGNHETYTGNSLWGLSRTSSPLEEAFYLQRFGFPGNELYYSFDWGGAHFVALDTFSSVGLSPEQVAWLEEDLRDNADAAWKIAFLHEPPWSSNDHGDSPRVQEAYATVLEALGVDLVIAAHDHGYERSWPMRGGEPATRDGNAFARGEGTIYLVTGGGGQSLYSAWTEPAPAWSAARGSFYHVTEFSITPERIDVRVVPTDGTRFADAFSILREPTDAGGVPAAAVDAAPIPALAPLAAVGAALGVALARRRA